MQVKITCKYSSIVMKIQASKLFDNRITHISVMSEFERNMFAGLCVSVEQ